MPDQRILLDGYRRALRFIVPYWPRLVFVLVAGIASTAWPFLAGLGVGWLAARGWRRPLAIRPEGLVIWLCTVALGMILRVVSGQGTALAFIVVALAFLALFLLGWRLLARLAPLAKRTQAAQAARR